jgi:acyl dehydratase
MSINRDCLGKTYGPVELTVAAEQIQAYADATGDPLPVYHGGDAVAPPVFGIVPVWPAIQEALADPALGLDVGRIVHGQQRMRFHRLIRGGDDLTSSGRVASIEDRGENEILVLSFETRDCGGEPFTEQDVVCVSRGTAAGRGTLSPPEPTPPAAPQREPDAARAVELPADITYRYASASGDDNRIHIDDEFARSVGLPGIIVQGMCLFSIALQTVVEEAAGGRPERLVSAAVRFRRPIRPASTFETLVYRNGSETRFEGRDRDGTLVLTGTATISPTTA